MSEYIQPQDYPADLLEHEGRYEETPDEPDLSDRLELEITSHCEALQKALHSPELGPFTGILPMMQLGTDAMAAAIDTGLVEPEDLFDALRLRPDVMAQLLSTIFQLSPVNLPGVIQTAQKKRLVEIAENLSHVWCQSLYHQVVFMTKVA